MLCSKKRIYPFAVLLPLFLMLLIYIHLGIAPFGNNSMVYSDAAGQYISYFSLYQDLITGRSDWSYSFSKLLGGSLSGLIAYYLASPLNLIVVLFPKTSLPIAMDILHLIKISLCGLTMAIYLYEVRGLTIEILPLSTAYAFSGYNIAYGWCTMWIDGVILLPIICLGIERLWHDGKPGIYICSLGIAIISNFYIGYMLCIFSMLYFASLAILNYKQLLDHRGIRIIQYSFSSLLAGGLSAFILIPGFIALSGGVPVSIYGSISRFTYPMALRILHFISPHARSIDSYVLPCLVFVLLLFSLLIIFITYSFIKYNTNHHQFYCFGVLCIFFLVIWYYLVDSPVQLWLGNTERRILIKFLIGYVDFKEFYNGSPNVYAGSVVFILAVCSFFNSRIPLNRRITGVFLFLIMLLSICFYLPNVIWHGFEKNNCFNYRYSFLLSFVLIILAGDSLHYSAGLSKLSMTGVLSFCLVVFLHSVQKPLRFLDLRITILSCIFLLVESIILFWWIAGGKCGFAAVCTIELFALLLTADMSLAEHTKLHSVRVDDFRTIVSKEQSRISSVIGQESDFYRIRKDGEAYSYNDPMLFSYPGLVHFSSSEKTDTIEFLEALGQQTFWPYWANGDLGESRSLDSLLGVRYYLGNNIPDYKQLQPGIQMNPYALPLAFTVSPDVLSNPSFENNVPENINKAFSMLMGKNIEIFFPVHIKNNTLKTVSTDPIYLYNPDGQIDKIEIWLSGEMIQKHRNLQASHLALLGSYPENSLLEFRFFDTTGKQTTDFANSQLYYEDTALLAAAAHKLCAVPVKTNKSIESKIELEIDSPENCIILLTIPYDQGWFVRIDGEKIASQKALGLLLAIPITRGNHQVLLEYSPPGLKLGCGISVFSFLISTIGIGFINRKKRTHNRV